MIRPVLTEFALFLAPFAAYAIFLLVTRRSLLHPDDWSWTVIAWLTIIALVCVLGSFIVIAQFSGEPIGSTYIPAHMENGKFVPGRTQ
ncbi:MAG: DUF6111 family protein [Pseudorhodoplanes sp.]